VRRRLLASRVILMVGVLLLVVAAIHLAVTPLLTDTVLDRVLAPEMMPIVAPPFLLNHIVVGILLLPLGFSMIYCARGIRAGERWAWVISFSTGIALLSLPVVLVLLMRDGRFNAVPFRVAELLITISAVAVPAVLLYVRREFFPQRGGAKAGTDGGH